MQIFLTETLLQIQGLSMAAVLHKHSSQHETNNEYDAHQYSLIRSFLTDILCKHREKST